MNLEQLGTGRVHIGFFFLIAALAGGLATLLSISIKPLEGWMERAKQRIADESYLDPDTVGKRDILRHSTLAVKMINALRVPGNDGETEYIGAYQIRAAFVRWCRFKLRTLRDTFKRTKATSPSRSAQPSINEGLRD